MKIIFIFYIIIFSYSQPLFGKKIIKNYSLIQFKKELDKEIEIKGFFLVFASYLQPRFLVHKCRKLK